MLREGSSVGVITVSGSRSEPFSDEQIELLKTFADQAVIAIENVRLFQELQARTRELTRSVEELQALGEVSRAVSSTLDLQTVLDTVVSRAVQLSGAHGGVIYEYEEGPQEFHLRASHRLEDELAAGVRAAPIRLGEGAVGQAATTRAPVQVADILDERTYGLTRIRAVMTRLGYRSLLAVPLLLEQRIMGALTVWRQEAGNFAPEIVSLLQTFAAQSVLAIQNARLFREIDAKSRELESLSQNMEQLYRLSTALQEPLSLGEQLTRVLDAARQVVRLDRLYSLDADPGGGRPCGHRRRRVHGEGLGADRGRDDPAPGGRRHCGRLPGGRAPALHRPRTRCRPGSASARPTRPSPGSASRASWSSR